MSSSKRISFQNVQIQVAKETDPSTGEVSYKVVKAVPEPVTITEADTIINYQLVPETPADVIFTGITITPANNQFSKPTISTDGKNLTLSDVNTQFGNYKRKFEFNGQAEADSGVAAKVGGDGNDIENRPPPPPPAAP